MTREISTFFIVIGSGLTLLAVAILMCVSGLDLVGLSKSNLLATVAFLPVSLLSPVLLSRNSDSQRFASAFLEYAGLLAFVSLAGVIASYPVAYFSSNFRDSLLQSIDHTLGFNWLRWYQVVSDHQWLQVIGRLLYNSIFVSPLAILAHFAYHNKRAMAHLFIASYWLAMIGTLLLFLFFPAEGPLAFLWHGPMHYIPQSGLYQAAIIPALKQHAMHDVRLDSLRGLVSAPSFHTTAAFLFVAAAWPSKGLRWPILLVNVAMLLAIPVEGTHYLIDMIAGMVVAVLALAIVRALLSHYGQASVGVPQFANPLKP